METVSVMDLGNRSKQMEKGINFFKIFFSSRNILFTSKGFFDIMVLSKRKKKQNKTREKDKKMTDYEELLRDLDERAVVQGVQPQAAKAIRELLSRVAELEEDAKNWRNFVARVKVMKAEQDARNNFLARLKELKYTPKNAEPDN